MSRRVVAAMGVWGLAIGSIALLFGGGHVQACLGPLGVTPESCRIALGLPPETDWDRFVGGPGPWLLILVAGWIAIVTIARWRERQRGGL